jgi:hypothetical protein
MTSFENYPAHYWPFGFHQEISFFLLGLMTAIRKRFVDRPAQPSVLSGGGKHPAGVARVGLLRTETEPEHLDVSTLTRQSNNAPRRLGNLDVLEKKPGAMQRRVSAVSRASRDPGQFPLRKQWAMDVLQQSRGEF